MKRSLSVIQPEGGSCSRDVTMNLSDQADAQGTFSGKAAVITLGCAKNQVDSEVMLGVLRQNGFEITNELAEADVAVVNTCGFLESAVKESIDSILAAAEFKEKGRLRTLLVAGCMVERYRDEITSILPEVDGFLAIDDLLKVGDFARSGMGEVLAASARPYFLYDDTMPRHLASKSHTAYVKVSEGCDRPCTFCIIPRIRGAMRSRSVESVAREVAMLGEQGVREINLVAQDLTAFGSDRGARELPQLLRALDATKAVDWIRLLYAYPVGTSDELLKTIVELPTICNYLDIPLQHSSEALLKTMKRPLGQFAPRPLVERIKTITPEIAIRTTFIVGFPGETEADIDDLENFIREGHFATLGVFTYSPEKGTPGAEMSGQIPEKVKQARRARLMKAQQDVMAKMLEGFIGREIPVLVEGTHDDTELLLVGRAEFQAPEVDSTVLINDIEGDPAHVIPGGMYRVEITEVAGYDLVGTVVSTDDYSVTVPVWHGEGVGAE